MSEMLLTVQHQMTGDTACTALSPWMLCSHPASARVWIMDGLTQHTGQETSLSYGTKFSDRLLTPFDNGKLRVEYTTKTEPERIHNEYVD